MWHRRLAHLNHQDLRQLLESSGEHITDSLDVQPVAVPVTLGLYLNRSVERIKGNQATFDNSQRNNLRSCVWVLEGSVGEDVRADFFPSR